MAPVPIDRIRNVALVGHPGAGKTTLVEALLHRSGMISRAGRVEDGTTVTDWEPLEKERGCSLSLAIASFSWRDHRITLLDAPGEPDLAAEMEAALRVADMAVIVVSAIEGVQVGTEAAWRATEALDLPRMVFVTKLDRDRSSFDRTLDQLRERFGAGIAPLELPIGEEGSFRGVADLLNDTALVYADGIATEGPIPDDLAALEHEVHDALVEGIVVADDALLERYLDGDVPSVAELEHTLRIGVDDATVFPVVLGSAVAEVAVDRLADLICDLGPSPADRPPVRVSAGDITVDVSPAPDGDPLAVVFKTIADRFVGHVSLFRVLSGTVRADDHLVNSRSGSDERLHGLVRLRGREQEPVSELGPGDIAAVAKLSDTRTGDTLSARGRPVRVEPPRVPEPLLAIAVSARTPADEDKLATALHALVDEDPALHVERVDATHQTVLRGVGDTHLAVALDALERRFGVDVATEPVAVAYTETIAGPAEAAARHKKQTGGHGQFAEVTLRVAPLGRGEGFSFDAKVVGGAVSKGYIPAVRKGVEEVMSEGGTFGVPVVDIAVTLVDGKEHAVDSSELAFRAAGRLALRAALAEAGPQLLEPVARIRVAGPPEIQGEVMGDLQSRRGHIEGTEVGPDGEQVVVALVPEAELGRYAVELRGLTAGRGSWTMAHDHYEIAPNRLPPVDS